MVENLSRLSLLSTKLSDRLKFFINLKKGWEDGINGLPLKKEFSSLIIDLLIGLKNKGVEEPEIGMVPEGGIEFLWLEKNIICTIYQKNDVDGDSGEEDDVEEEYVIISNNTIKRNILYPLSNVIVNISDFVKSC